MRLLFTSDWQCDFTNLQECEIALEELLAAAAKYGLDAVIHAGDLKDAYSPVDVEVVKFCVRMVRRIRQAGHRLIILLGNHDRVSQSAESKNWLDVLQAAGAEIVTKPKIKQIADAAVALLPYASDSQVVLRGAKALSEGTQGHTGPRILVFHAEVAGTVINAGGRLGRGLTAEDLGFAGYDACLGGHIHRSQRIADNGWYIGSPFCQDWGEADSDHGHVLLSIDEKGVKVRHLRSRIPHWYNLEYLEKSGVKPEPGAYIRSKVRVSSKRITDQLREEEEHIRAKYGDVRIHTVPELIDEMVPETLLRGSTDREKIEQYVAATMTEEHRFEPGQAVAYMLAKLAHLKEGAVGTALRFESVEAENVLVLEEAKLKLANLGLVLIRGVNENWPGRSNGAGKSSLLSLIPIAMFGQTVGKKQKADAWACERNTETALVTLHLTDEAKRRVDIIRGRRPHRIELRINGEDKSSGIRGTGKDETQGLIERVTGYDMQMLRNAVYIDQAVANGFVFGTPSGRMDLISRFQNLERFDAARSAVVEDIKAVERRIIELTSEADLLENDIDTLESDLAAESSAVETDWASKLAEARQECDRLVAEHAAVSNAAQFIEELQRTIADLESDRRRETKALETSGRLVGALKDRVDRGRELMESGNCPTCGQPSRKAGAEMLRTNQERLSATKEELTRSRASLTDVERRMDVEKTKLRNYETRIGGLEDDIEHARQEIRTLEQAAAQEDERNRRREATLEAKRSQLALKKRYHRAAVGARQYLSVAQEMMEYAKRAFHRSGIPLYLSMALCPLLNRAASEYSDIFTDGNLKVSFRVEDSEFVVDVINPSGSKTVDGQSVGEAAMAGIIAAFALREAAPKTNLLILDEPGHGLDPEGCRQFARGILKLKDRFETILLVTHSAYIASMLSGETIYSVRKSNGRSRLFLSS